jgi:CheY-like chemotaxis protein
MKPSILVVDDEPLTCNLLRLMLEPAGFEVTQAASGREALEKMKKNLPDALILDIMMPFMDGLTVCKEVRLREEAADLPIIILSAKARLSAQEESLAAGADRFLSKPTSRNDLIGAIREVLQAKKPGAAIA